MTIALWKGAKLPVVMAVACLDKLFWPGENTVKFAEAEALTGKTSVFESVPQRVRITQ